jgi:hypothetical protein
MNKSKSVPLNLCDEGVYSMRKSTSLSVLNETDAEFFFYDEFFEGDGPLGIGFTELNGHTVIKSICRGTVASEYYKLKIDMILIEIGDKNVLNIPYEKKMKMIVKEWKENSMVYLKFKKSIHHDIMKTLNQQNLLKYYDDFVDLGAKTLEDFEYIERTDLVKMNFTKEEIQSFLKINPGI